MTDKQTAFQQKKKKQAPKKITASYLENAALFYLQRFDSTAENLRRVLRRKVKRAAIHPEANIDFERTETWIDDVIRKMQHLGYIDDARTANIKARSLFSRGTAPRLIRQKLMQAGAPPSAIEQALETLAEDNGKNLSFLSAVKLARRRRLGPFRDRDKREEKRDKDLAALARAGFDLDTARKVIDANDQLDLLDIDE